MEDEAGIEGEEGGVGTAAEDAEGLAAAALDEAEVDEVDQGKVDAAKDLPCGVFVVEGATDGLAGIVGGGGDVDGAGVDVAAGGLDVWFEADDGGIDADLDAAEGCVRADRARVGGAAQVEGDFDGAKGKEGEADAAADSGGPEGGVLLLVAAGGVGVAGLDAGEMVVGRGDVKGNLGSGGGDERKQKCGEKQAANWEAGAHSQTSGRFWDGSCSWSDLMRGGRYLGV